MVRSTDRSKFRQKMNNAIPSLLNTLDILQSKKMSEEEKESDEFDIDENIKA
jgi:hypothetical protein